LHQALALQRAVERKAKQGILKWATCNGTQSNVGINNSRQPQQFEVLFSVQMVDQLLDPMTPDYLQPSRLPPPRSVKILYGAGLDSGFKFFLQVNPSWIKT
jgi:hypothetical protein